MSSYNALNSADAADVQSFISGVIKHTADGNYVLDSAINPITATTLASDSSMLLLRMGLDETPENVSAATTIARNIADGTLRGEGLSNFNDYDANTSTSFVLSPFGNIANAVNTLYDSQASQILEPSQKSVYNATSGIGKPSTTAESLAKTSQTNGKQATTNPAQKNISTITSPDYYAKPLIDFQPKFRYAFIAQINLYGEYQRDIPTSCAFLIKKFDKPKTTIEYEEVNFYNFFSQVPKRTKFSPITLNLHDDIKNESMNFIVSYLRRICPIFNQEQSMNFEEHGMEFQNANSSYGLHTTTSALNIIQSIKVFDIYNGSRTMDVYTFNNPKITEISLDDWNMESMDPTEVTLDIVYDNWYVNVGVAPSIPQNILGVSELLAGPAAELTAPGAKYDSKYTNLLVTDEQGRGLDNIDQLDIQDGQVGDNVLSPEQLNTVSNEPFNLQKEIANLNVQKNDPITSPAANIFNDSFKSLPPVNEQVPGLNNDQLMNALAPIF